MVLRLATVFSGIGSDGISPSLSATVFWIIVKKDEEED